MLQLLTPTEFPNPASATPPDPHRLEYTPRFGTRGSRDTINLRHLTDEQTLERQRQNRRKPWRCDWTTVAGLTNTIVSRKRGHNRY
jgi:hypothetical protein